MMYKLVENMANLATERINVRSTVDAKIVIEQAANLLGLSVSSFMIQSSFERAKELLKSNYMRVIKFHPLLCISICFYWFQNYIVFIKVSYYRWG